MNTDHIPTTRIAALLDEGLAAVDLSDAIAARDALQAQVDEIANALAHARSQEEELNRLLHEAERQGLDPACAADAFLAGRPLDELPSPEALAARKASMRAVVKGLEQRHSSLESQRFADRDGVAAQLGTAGDAALEVLGEAALDALARLASIRAIAGVIRGATRSRAEGRLERQVGEAIAGWRSEHGAPIESPTTAPEWLVETLERHFEKISAAGGRIRVQLVDRPIPDQPREPRQDDGPGSAVLRGVGMAAPAGELVSVPTTDL